ncbi:hypothetical protein DsansV1_C35g0229831 [Dioscorea sansibarensis]
MSPSQIACELLLDIKLESIIKKADLFPACRRTIIVAWTTRNERKIQPFSL